jgi:hypothetical protein
MKHGKDNPALPFTGEQDEVPTLVRWARMEYPTAAGGGGHHPPVGAGRDAALLRVL